MNTRIRRAALRYHGGKYRLREWIISHLPKHRVYVEPYGGAGSILFGKDRCYSEVYNDLNDDVVNFFRVLRDPEQSAQLARLLTLTPYARKEFDAAYDPCPDDPVERARRLVVRSFMGFGSAASHRVRSRTGFRPSALRSGSVPAADWASYPASLVDFTERLIGVTIECRPALEVIAQLDSEETLFYVDPPYLGDVRGARQVGNYGAFELTEGGHRELAAALLSVKGMVVLSGYPSGLYTELYAGWRSVSRGTHADGARDRVETLWMNDAACGGWIGRLEV